MSKPVKNLSVLSAEEALENYIHIHDEAGSILLRELRAKYDIVILDIPRFLNPFTLQCLKQAEALGLQGWVRNRHDGSVEALASGALEAVERLIAWAHVGPPAARVSRVEITELDDSGEPGAPFAQRPTA